MFSDVDSDILVCHKLCAGHSPKLALAGPDLQDLWLRLHMVSTPSRWYAHEHCNGAWFTQWSGGCPCLLSRIFAALQLLWWHRCTFAAVYRQCDVQQLAFKQGLWAPWVGQKCLLRVLPAACRSLPSMASAGKALAAWVFAACNSAEFGEAQPNCYFFSAFWCLVGDSEWLKIKQGVVDSNIPMYLVLTNVFFHCFWMVFMVFSFWVWSMPTSFFQVFCSWLQFLYTWEIKHGVL